MGFLAWLMGISSGKSIASNKGYAYERVKEADIPDWVLKQHLAQVKNGAETTSHEGSHYRYILGPHNCWRRKTERAI